MTQLEKLLIQQLKELAEQFNQQSIKSNQQFEDLATRLRETNQRLEDMTTNYQNLRSGLAILQQNESQGMRQLQSSIAELMKELRS